MSKTKIYVGGWPLDLRDVELRQKIKAVYSNFGPVVSVEPHVSRKKDFNDPFVYAFIKFENEESAISAYKDNGKWAKKKENYELKVNWALESSPLVKDWRCPDPHCQTLNDIKNPVCSNCQYTRNKGPGLKKVETDMDSYFDCNLTPATSNVPSNVGRVRSTTLTKEDFISVGRGKLLDADPATNVSIGRGRGRGRRRRKLEFEETSSDRTEKNEENTSDDVSLKEENVRLKNCIEKVEESLIMVKASDFLSQVKDLNSARLELQEHRSSTVRPGDGSVQELKRRLVNVMESTKDILAKNTIAHFQVTQKVIDKAKECYNSCKIMESSESDPTLRFALRNSSVSSGKHFIAQLRDRALMVDWEFVLALNKEVQFLLEKISSKSGIRHSIALDIDNIEELLDELVEDSGRLTDVEDEIPDHKKTDDAMKEFVNSLKALSQAFDLPPGSLTNSVIDDLGPKIENALDIAKSEIQGHARLRQNRGSISQLGKFLPILYTLNEELWSCITAHEADEELMLQIMNDIGPVENKFEEACDEVGALIERSNDRNNVPRCSSPIVNHDEDDMFSDPLEDW